MSKQAYFNNYTGFSDYQRFQGEPIIVKGLCPVQDFDPAFDPLFDAELARTGQKLHVWRDEIVYEKPEG